MHPYPLCSKKPTTLVVFNGGNPKLTVLNVIFNLRQYDQPKNKQAFVHNSTTPVQTMLHILSVDGVHIDYLWRQQSEFESKRQ